jgi:hypothetical protein
MALSIIGYFGSMMASFAMIMMLLFSFVAPSSQHHPYLNRYPIHSFAQKPDGEKKAAGGVPPALAFAAVPVPVPAPAVADTERLQKARRMDAERSKRMRQAQYEKRKLAARERAGREYSAVLGYAQEPSYGSPYGPFATRRF